MTTDPTYEDTYDPTIDIFQMMKPYRGGDSFYTIDPAGIVDAYLRAAVACQQCQGTGEVPNLCNRDHERGPCPPGHCPGPHTQVNIGDCVHGATHPHGGDEFLQPCPGDEILNTDPDLIGQWTNADGEQRPHAWVPLPPGWTVT